MKRSFALKHTKDKNFKDDRPKTGRLTLTSVHRLYIWTTQVKSLV